MEIINLFGAGGHAKVIMDIIKAQGDLVGCIYDDAPLCNEINGSPIQRVHDSIVEGPLIISIGSNRIRERLAYRYPVRYAKAIHPSAIVSEYTRIGHGTVVMQGTVIQTDSVIGRHCIVNTGATIDHECHICDFVHVSPHATLCGNVHIGTGAWIGAGAIIIPGVKIGQWAIIGAGSVVTHDIPDGVKAYGNPCKIITTQYNR